MRARSTRRSARRATGGNGARLRPVPPIPWPSVPPLISHEEALALGEVEDHSEIEGLVERAWEARTGRFGESTDMCSLVTAKSGGCAENCGFCAQWGYAGRTRPCTR